MLRNYKDVAEVILGVIIFCIVFVAAEKSGIRESIVGTEALLPRGMDSVGRLAPTESFYDLGRVFMHEEEKDISFEIKNEGGKDLSVKKIYTTCQCLEVSLRGRGFEIGPFSVRDYLYQRAGGVIVGRGEKIDIDMVYYPALQGPFGVGLSEPYAVLEDEFGVKTILRISALVLP